MRALPKIVCVRGASLLLLLLSPILLRAQSAPSWNELLERATREQKPLLVLFAPPSCPRCGDFEERTLPHPAIQRRLPSVIFATFPTTSEPAKAWHSSDGGVALFDHSGTLLARWPIVPQTASFRIMLDAAVSTAADFERALKLRESGHPYDADLETGNALARLGRENEARIALLNARDCGEVATRQFAIIALARLETNTDKRGEAIAMLGEVANQAATAQIAANAAMAIGDMHRATGAVDDAIRAYDEAVSMSDPGSPTFVAATKMLNALRALQQPRAGAIRILPLTRPIVTGSEDVRTHVTSAAVARVSFAVDNRERIRISDPPFSARLDFGSIPERHVIRVIAVDRKGREIGRDERVINEAGETFALRLISPREGEPSGDGRVSMNVRVPSAHVIRRVVVSWNDAERAVLTEPPWTAVVRLPQGRLGVLRAVAELDDGRTTEDAVLLNAGIVTEANVQLVELPVTIVNREGMQRELAPEHILVREGRITRPVESIATSAETPLTIGMLIDTSDSMERTLPDVQEAATHFLETILAARDRAFLITFDSRAHLTQTATSNVALLREKILRTNTNGLTALHDAMILGLLQFEGVKGRRALVVFSDGGDRTSQYSSDDVRELARRMNVPIHVIASIENTPARLNESAPPLPGWTFAEWDASTGGLRRIAESTGGSTQTLDNLAELPRVYQRIEAALRAQYLVFIRTDPAKRENEWRAIKVRVDDKNVETFAPAGYYATW
jgi:Ca-activated chloride channel family protein